MVDYYKKRRTHLIKQMSRGSVAIISTSAIAIRNRDADYPYRPDSDFYYLTGFAEPEAVAVLVSPLKGKAKFILFCRERDPARANSLI